MRTFFNISFIQLLLAVISALLMAQMSWVGKMGISLFYKDYAILKDPISSGVSIFVAQMVVIIILHLLYILTGRKALRIACIFFFLLAAIGLAYTINDFRQELSHRMLKYKFHYGFYLIWGGMMLSTLYYFFLPQRKIKSKDTVV